MDNLIRQGTRLRSNSSDFENSNSDLEDVLFIQSKPKIISQNVSKNKSSNALKCDKFSRMRASVSVKRNMPFISDSSTGISRQGEQSGIFAQTTKNDGSKRITLNSPKSALGDGRRIQQLKNMVITRT